MVRLVVMTTWILVIDIMPLGSVCYLHVLGQGIVFINTAQAVIDLMDKRGAIYSDRPQSVRLFGEALHSIITPNKSPNQGYDTGIVSLFILNEPLLLNFVLDVVAKIW